MFYGHAMFIGGNSQRGSRYLSLLLGLSLSRPVDTKTDFNLNNIIATLSFYFYFFGKKNSPANVRTRTQTWSQLRSMNAKAGRATRPRRHNLCALTLVRCKTIDPFSTTSSESQESYLATGMLPYKHSSFFPSSHGSIMLPPRQPRVFARLARW